MSRSKRHQRLVSIEEKNSPTSISTSIETPTSSFSRTTEHRLEHFNEQDSSPMNQLINWHEQPNGSHHEKSRSLEDQSGIPIKAKGKQVNANRPMTMFDKTPSSHEDDWVCPVAVVLRRAGYNVPLRPSKSWLERDRKQQALLRQRQT